MPSAFCGLVKGRGSQSFRQEDIRSTGNGRVVPDPGYKTRHSELSLRMRAGSVHLQRLARLNGKAVFKSDPATGARVIPVKLIFVRHAETEWNRHGIIQGHKDSPLTARGALETSALLTALTDAGYPVDGVFTSLLGRAWRVNTPITSSRYFNRMPRFALPAASRLRAKAGKDES